MQWSFDLRPLRVNERTGPIFCNPGRVKAQSLLSRVVNNVIVLRLINVIVDNVNVMNEDNVNVDVNVSRSC
jgi:hypothetical protein